MSAGKCSRSDVLLDDVRHHGARADANAPVDSRDVVAQLGDALEIDDDGRGSRRQPFLQAHQQGRCRRRAAARPAVRAHQREQLVERLRARRYSKRLVTACLEARLRLFPHRPRQRLWRAGTWMRSYIWSNLNAMSAREYLPVFANPSIRSMFVSRKLRLSAACTRFASGEPPHSCTRIKLLDVARRARRRRRSRAATRRRFWRCDSSAPLRRRGRSS